MLLTVDIALEASHLVCPDRRWSSVEALKGRCACAQRGRPNEASGAIRIGVPSTTRTRETGVSNACIWALANLWLLSVTTIGKSPDHAPSMQSLTVTSAGILSLYFSKLWADRLSRPGVHFAVLQVMHRYRQCVREDA